MKLYSFRAVATVAVLTIVFAACQKDKKEAVESLDTEVATHTDDEARFSAEIDAVANESDALLETEVSFSGRGQNIYKVCGGTVEANATTDPKTITITYNGLNCRGSATRTGKVVITVPKQSEWKTAGATASISFQNYKVTRVADNKSITINGTKQYTNVSGGLLINLSNGEQIVHSTASSDMSITFDNGTQRKWQIAKQRVYTYDNGIVISISGTHTQDGQTNVAEWGTNRFGRAFTAATKTPVIIKQSCAFRATGGVVLHTTVAYKTEVTFGLDAAGNVTICPGNGLYYMKLVWTKLVSGASVTVLIPY